MTMMFKLTLTALLVVVLRPRSIEWICAIALIVANIKLMPTVWHLRVFWTMLRTVYSPGWSVGQISRANLFDPFITSCRTAIGECDWNGHKSNSSYYSDLDVARTAIVGTVLKKAIVRKSEYFKHIRKEGLVDLVPVRIRPRRLEDTVAEAATAAGCPAFTGTTSGGSDDGEFRFRPVSGRLVFALGATSTVFVREILPMVRTEFWSRIAGWDRKWIYVFTDIVECESVSWKGSIRQWACMPWMATNKDTDTTDTTDTTEDIPGHSKFTNAIRNTKAQKSVYARSLSRYVVKKGSITVPPELVLRRSDMLPAMKPAWAVPAVEVSDIQAIRTRLADMTGDETEMARKYVEMMIRDWNDMDDSKRLQERERRDMIEPVGPDVTKTYDQFYPPSSNTRFGPDYIPSTTTDECEWIEAEVKRVENLLRLGDGFAGLDCVVAPSTTALGEFYDL